MPKPSTVRKMPLRALLLDQPDQLAPRWSTPTLKSPSVARIDAVDAARDEVARARRRRRAGCPRRRWWSRRPRAGRCAARIARLAGRPASTAARGPRARVDDDRDAVLRGRAGRRAVPSACLPAAACSASLHRAGDVDAGTRGCAAAARRVAIRVRLEADAHQPVLRRSTGTAPTSVVIANGCSPVRLGIVVAGSS